MNMYYRPIRLTHWLLFYMVYACLGFWGCHQKTSPAPIQRLGHYLFFEPQLSANHTKSCASCHAPQFAFTDGYKRSLGMVADVHKHNAQSLVNAAQYRFLNWANPDVTSFEQQMERPLFGTTPLEMGCNKSDLSIPLHLGKQPLYQTLFREAFPHDSAPFRWENIIHAIAAYEKTLLSFESPYDAYKKGDTNALNPAAKRGEKLFFSHNLKCMTCHRVPLFTVAGDTTEPSPFFNIGLYNTSGNYPAGDQGLYEITKIAEDKGKFRVPTLRNIGFTAPYMHDGSVATLREVIDIYARGGRNITYGNHQGDGKNNPYKDNRVHGFPITESEKNDLLEFLMSLNDSSILKKTNFENPFSQHTISHENP